MTTPNQKPRVFIDADVLFAGSASPSEHGASHVILRMAEITLIDAFTSEQVITEVERNLKAKIPKALPAFRHLTSRCLKVVSNPKTAVIQSFMGKADKKDLPILVAAACENCTWLVTFNIKHFQPGIPSITILRPGDFILRVRDLLTLLN